MKGQEQVTRGADRKGGASMAHDPGTPLPTTGSRVKKDNARKRPGRPSRDAVLRLERQVARQSFRVLKAAIANAKRKDGGGEGKAKRAARSPSPLRDAQQRQLRDAHRFQDAHVVVRDLMQRWGKTPHEIALDPWVTRLIGGKSRKRITQIAENSAGLDPVWLAIEEFQRTYCGPEIIPQRDLVDRDTGKLISDKPGEPTPAERGDLWVTLVCPRLTAILEMVDTGGSIEFPEVGVPETEAEITANIRAKTEEGKEKPKMMRPTAYLVGRRSVMRPASGTQGRLGLAMTKDALVYARVAEKQRGPVRMHKIRSALRELRDDLLRRLFFEKRLARRVVYESDPWVAELASKFQLKSTKQVVRILRRPAKQTSGGSESDG